jgi:hypothetical protein
MNTQRRIHKTTKETDKDFYQTNPYMVLALKEWLIENGFSNEVTILDPCCGQKVIGDGLRDTFPNIIEIDKFPEEGESIDFMDYEPDRKVDIVIMNSPYSNKYNFINRAMEMADHVFSLLPLNVSNYNMFHREFEDIHEFVGKLQMAPKMFLDQTTDFRPGGTAQYCFYYWKKDKHTTDYSKTWYKDLIKIKEREENK